MQKPSKPRPDFPLFPHGNGQWAKKFFLSGKHTLKYFGPWKEDPKGEQAIRDYLSRRDGILAGLDNLRPEVVSDTMTVVEMLKRFLKAKHAQLQAGDLADETLNDYTYELQLFANLLGPDARAASIGPEEFRRYLENVRKARKLGPHRLGTVIRSIRAAFNHASKNGWIPPVNFGTEFSAPNTDPESLAVRKVRKGEDADDDPIYTPAQLEWLLSHATKQFRAMILIMVNCGMGPSDVARLKWQHIDFETGRLSLRRSKNGIRRECWLWKKTRAALMEVRKLKHNREALEKDVDAALVFLTRKGLAYVRRERVMDGERVQKTKLHNAISITIGRLVKAAKAAGIIPKGKKLTAYNFRHTYRTHADNSPDLNAVLRTMGRKLYGQSDHRYVRGGFKLVRLKRVAKTVNRHLFPKPKAPVTKPESPQKSVMRLVGGESDSTAA